MLAFSHFYCILGVDSRGFLWTSLVSHNCPKIVLLYALFADLSAVHRLMSNESTPLLSRNSRTASTTSSVKNYTDFSSFTCPSCRMPFDKAKKRRLVDTCGHERCYACMFRNETCPICNASGEWKSRLSENWTFRENQRIFGYYLEFCSKILSAWLSLSGI